MASAIAGTVATKVRGALSHKDSNGSLLQLAQQDGGPDDGSGFIDTSVITQVTTRDVQPPTISRNDARYVSSVSATTPRSKGDLEEVDASRNSWRAKFRALLCCLAPAAHDQYVCCGGCINWVCPSSSQVLSTSRGPARHHQIGASRLPSKLHVARAAGADAGRRSGPQDAGAGPG